MTEARTVLFELGTEELPPRSLEALRESLAAAVIAELESAGLPFDRGCDRVRIVKALGITDSGGGGTDSRHYRNTQGSHRRKPLSTRKVNRPGRYWVLPRGARSVQNKCSVGKLERIA